MQRLTIGKLAAAAGVGVETVRYYERRGLIEQPPRQRSGYRQYPQDLVQRILFIKNTQNLGFSLKEIGTVLDLMDGREMNCAHAAHMLDNKITETGRKIKALQQMKKLLTALRNSVGTCGAMGQIDFLSEFLSRER